MNGALTLHPKTAATGLAGALGVVIVWALGLAHQPVDDATAAAIVLVLTFAGSWLAPLVKRELPASTESPASTVTTTAPVTDTSKSKAKTPAAVSPIDAPATPAP